MSPAISFLVNHLPQRFFPSSIPIFQILFRLNYVTLVIDLDFLNVKKFIRELLWEDVSASFGLSIKKFQKSDPWDAREIEGILTQGIPWYLIVLYRTYIPWYLTFSLTVTKDLWLRKNLRWLTTEWYRNNFS